MYTICDIGLFTMESLPSIVEQVFHGCQGWCQLDKAINFYNVAILNNYKLCVEIGVFGGKSFFPLAFAMLKTNGMVIGIDPYSKIEAYQIGLQWIDEITNAVDFDALFTTVTRKIDDYYLQSHCSLLRQTASQANHSILDNTIDLLHIDGNHGEEAVLVDIVLYLPKVRSGGLICFDDASWDTIQKAQQYATDNGCVFLYKICDTVVFKKN